MVVPRERTGVELAATGERDRERREAVLSARAAQVADSVEARE
jgi:hypothetical protein